MPYKPGRPLTDRSIFFTIAAHLTFYPVEFIAYGFYRCYYHSKITGRTKLQGLKKAILVSNHTTFLDPVLMGAAVLFRRTYHTLLEATVKSPFLGTFVRLLGGMPIPRGGRGDQEFERLCRGCEEALRRWPFVHFYPEGECYLYNNTVRRFRLGAFWAAAKIDVPVVPMATVFHPGHPGTSRPRVELVVLEPLYPKDFIQYDEAGIVNPESVTAFANAARTRIQAEIDKRRGTGAYYKGAMPRLESINAE